MMAESFNKSTTASEVAKFYADRIADKVVLTTGVSPKSLGAEFVQTIAAYGPKLLILAGRNRSKLEETEKAIHDACSQTQTRLLILDLADQSQIRNAAQEVNNYSEKIDVLVNNAAVMAQPWNTTKEGLEMQFGSNHIGHFLFTNLILGKILASPEPRIVNVASNGHRNSAIRWDDWNFSDGKTYNKWTAYSQAKNANMLFTIGLAARYGTSRNLKTYSLHPGVISTSLGEHLDQSDFEEMIEMDRELMKAEPDLPNPWGGEGEPSLDSIQFVSVQQGTATHVVAAFGTLGKNGAYLEECQIAPDVKVRKGAGSPDNAERLWKLSEDIIGESFTA